MQSLILIYSKILIESLQGFIGFLIFFFSFNGNFIPPFLLFPFTLIPVVFPRKPSTTGSRQTRVDKQIYNSREYKITIVKILILN